MARASWFVVVAAALAACKKPSDKAPAGSGSPQGSAAHDGSPGGDSALQDTTAAVADAAAAVDAAIDLAAAVWPTSIVSSDEEIAKKAGEVAFELSLPRFRTTPDAIGKELDAKLAPLAELGYDPKKYTGTMSLSCKRLVVNRLVAIIECA